MRMRHLRYAVLVVAFWSLGGARVFAAAAGAPTISPDEALARLMAGNERFQTDQSGHPLLHSKRREELVGGQSPFAVILSCSDSRVPPELIFDQGLGGLFVVRVAGNTVTRAGLESIDYAVRQLGTNPDHGPGARQVRGGQRRCRRVFVEQVGPRIARDLRQHLPGG
jgi:carbonic anhydrase